MRRGAPRVGVCWGMRTLCIGIAVSGWCLACSDASAALALRAAIDVGRCGARLLPHRVNLLHAIASDPRLPLRPPSFFSSNAPPRVVHNVSCPRLASPLYAGMDPWIARGGLDPIGALVDAMTRAKPFESAAMTMARLFLRDKASARRTFVCAIVRANSPSVRGNDGFARYPSASIDGDLTRFLHTFAPSLDAVDAEVRAICPRLPRLADAALAAARRCDGAAEALARLLVDHWMALEATELYNPASANPMGFLNLAGVSPSTLLYATPYPQVRPPPSVAFAASQANIITNTKQRRRRSTAASWPSSRRASAAWTSVIFTAKADSVRISPAPATPVRDSSSPCPLQAKSSCRATWTKCWALSCEGP